MNIEHVGNFSIYSYNGTLIAFIFRENIYYADCHVNVNQYDIDTLYGIINRAFEKDISVQLAIENGMYLDEDKIYRQENDSTNDLNNLVIIERRVCAVIKKGIVHYIDKKVYCSKLKDVSKLNLEDSIERNIIRKSNSEQFNSIPTG